MNIIYNDTKKDLPSEQLYKLFVAVGWSGTSDTPDMIKNYNNLVSLCGGQGYSFEKVLYTEMEEANYAIKLVPTIDSYNYIYIYRNGDK